MTNAVTLAGELATDIEFEERHVIATEKGWVVPGESNPFYKHTWNFYWQQCESHEKDPSSGRPVPPHRSA